MNEQVNYAKIQRIQDDLDALVIGQFGTGFVTDNMLYESGIKAAVAQHTSDLAESMKLAEKSGIIGWRQPNQDKKIVFVGDSTTQNAVDMFNQIINFHINSGDLLSGTNSNNVINMGSNGNTLANFLNNAPSGKGINDVIALQPNLIVFCYGINDVRLGVTTQQQLIDMHKTAIEKLLKETNAYIVLRTPNSLCSDSPNGYISPSNAGQTYTDILWNTYEYFRGKYPRTAVLDFQTLIFGRTSLPVASSPLKADELHPNSGAQYYEGDEIAKFIGERPTPQIWKCNKAEMDNSTFPYLSYLKYLEYKPDLYELVAQGYFVAMGSNYIDFKFDPNKAISVIKGGYILKVGDELVYDLPSNAYATTQGTNTRLLNVTFSDYANNKKGMVKIYKPKAVSSVKSFNFWGTNMSGLQFAQYGSLDNKSLISTIAGALKTPIVTGVATTFDVKISSGATVKTLGTLSFPNNNMTATFSWNTTDFPNSNTTIYNTDFLYIVCGTTTYTGEISIRLGIS